MPVAPRHAKDTATGWTIHTLTGHNGVSHSSSSGDGSLHHKQKKALKKFNAYNKAKLH